MLKIIRHIAFAGLLAAPLALMSAAPAVAQAAPAISAEWSNYMTADAVNATQNENSDVQVIDIRAEKYVVEGTIPGAVWIPFPQWRGVDDRPRQPILADDLAVLLGGAGIALDKPIVVHNHSSHPMQSGRAAIVYWILKSAGAQDIAILNGGFKAWREAALPEALAPAVRQPVSIDVAYNGDWTADPLDIYAITTGQTNGAILDARLEGQVRKAIETGDPMMSMPMAQYMPASFFMSQLTAQNMAAPAIAEFRADLEARGIEIDSEMLISVCQTGELSALSWFYASEIVGIENVRYYPDALRGWAGDGGLMFGLDASL